MAWTTEQGLEGCEADGVGQWFRWGLFGSCTLLPPKNLVMHQRHPLDLHPLREVLLPIHHLTGLL